MSELSKLPTFGKDGAIHVVVESPRGSTLKFKYEPELGAFSISRPLPLACAIPTIGVLSRARARRMEIRWMR